MGLRFAWASVALAAALGAAAADEPRVWDFTRQAPPGARLREAGFLSADGLGTHDSANEAAQGGAELTDATTPDGAFLFEAEFQVGDFAATSKVERVGRIWDDMGINYGGKCDNTGLEIGLKQQPDGYWTPYAIFGMGDARFRVDGVKRRLYDGAVANLSLHFGGNGRVVMEFGGLVAEKTIPRCGGLAKSKRYRPVIGSRPVRRYANFDGFIRRVSITPMQSDPAYIATPGRMAFLRGETNAVLAMAIANRSGGALRDMRFTTRQFGGEGLVKTSEFRLGELADGGELPVSVPVETRIRPGRHSLRTTLRARDASGEEVVLSNDITYAIGPQVGDRIRVAIWGMALETPPEVIGDFGFTHSYVYLGGPREIDSDFDPKPFLNTLDLHLVGGIRTLRALAPPFYPAGADTNRYVRLDAAGRPGAHPQPEVSNPALVDRFRSICAFDASLFAGHPAFQGVLPYSERREHSFPSFNTEHLRYKAETGRDVPAGARGKQLPLAEARRRFPDGVVPDADELYLFYRWWLKGGDGWPAFQSAGVDEFRRRIPDAGFQSFWDPSVRWAPAWGAGGSVDMLNQWCYAVPEPMNVAGPCEEVLAMAAGRPGQKASIMTQLICYRSTLAPKNAPVANAPKWAAEFPDASFPVVPPDVLQEATWAMIAKPVDAIMFHGWNTIFDNHTKTGYCFTNPESAKRLREVLCGVVTPLGPVLRRLKRRPPDFAVLESMTTFMMGGPATLGWNAPTVTCAQRARLDPRVVYEDTILRDGLDGVKVLYAPQCQFLPESIVGRIWAFQRAGGILVADADCLPALKADIVMTAMSFNPPAGDHTEEVEASEMGKPAASKPHRGTVETKRVQQEAAGKLRRELAERGYKPQSDSSSPEIFVFNRRWRNTPYLFAINDRRGFGDYVGPWGLVMEKGLPFDGWVSIDDPEMRIGAVYELSRGAEAAFRREGETIKVPVSFTTNDGRMFVFLPRRIAAIDVATPLAVERGGEVAVTMAVLDSAGGPVPALLPVEIRLYDANGREIDGGGWFCAEGGVARVAFQTNLDDPDGGYRVVCKDKASGLWREVCVGQELKQP